VLECLRARKRPPRRLFLIEGGRGLEPIRDAARSVPVETARREVLDRMAKEGNHQGALLVCALLVVSRLADWLKGAIPEDALVVILDGIEDPHNFGAVVRSAAACGAAGVLFGKDRAAPLSPAAAKAAAGGIEYIDLLQETNLPRAVRLLQDAGFWVAGLDADGDRLLWDADLKGRIALVVGSEGRGVRRLVLEHCDWRLRIPLPGAISSLNASVSAGIALAECLRQRRKN